MPKGHTSVKVMSGATEKSDWFLLSNGWNMNALSLYCFVFCNFILKVDWFKRLNVIQN